ncbi:hypothetical protein RUM43_013352 [Polyplax serrata]|uniref:Uncharacterized protein n=1 Tax=Polyplax serrata TaxID=468196 RepID=A0AAN8PRL0_POLSC
MEFPPAEPKTNEKINRKPVGLPAQEELKDEQKSEGFKVLSAGKMKKKSRKKKISEETISTVPKLQNKHNIDGITKKAELKESISIDDVYKYSENSIQDLVNFLTLISPAGSDSKKLKKMIATMITDIINTTTENICQKVMNTGKNVVMQDAACQTLQF